MIQQPQNRKQRGFFYDFDIFQQKSLYFSLKNFASNLDF